MEGKPTGRYKAAELAPRLAAFLTPVLRETGFDVQFDVTEGAHAHPDFEDPEVVVKFRGRDVDFLLGNRAELLLALEHLAMEMLRMPAEDHSLLCFDANDYRILRIEELRLSATTAAEKVKRTRVPFHFNPMSSRERRIIHLSLRNETDVRSESTGTGPQRQVVIVPSEMKEVPAPIIRPAFSRSGPGGERGPGGPPRRGEGRDGRRPFGPPRGGR